MCVERIKESSIYCLSVGFNWLEKYLRLASGHLLIRGQQRADQKNVWNLFTFNNKNTKPMSMTLFWCPNCYFWVDFTNCSVLFNFEQVNADWETSGVVGRKIDIKETTESSSQFKFSYSNFWKLSSTHFTWSILECFVPFRVMSNT